VRHGTELVVVNEQQWRRHRARQLRARIRLGAQEYEEACRQHQALWTHVLAGDLPLDGILEDEECTLWGAMQMRREELRALLRHLEIVQNTEEDQ
jgi:hypothetical protein